MGTNSTPPGTSVTLFRHADGSVTVARTQYPRAWDRARTNLAVEIAFWVAMGLVAAGTAGWATGVIPGILAVGAGAVIIGAIVLGAVVPLIRHGRHARWIDFDWRAEAMRCHHGRTTTTIPFSRVTGIRTAVQWGDLERHPSFHEVFVETGSESLLVGQFASERDADEWVAELREMMGVSTDRLDMSRHRSSGPD